MSTENFHAGETDEGYDETRHKNSSTKCVISGGISLFMRSYVLVLLKIRDLVVIAERRRVLNSASRHSWAHQSDQHRQQ
jgi:hypothetical protein